MKIFQSDLTTEVVLGYKKERPAEPLRALISYGRRNIHQSNLMISHRKFLDDLIMDSGTFTLNNNLKEYRDSITFKGYMSYLKHFAGRVDFYFNYDEDFSPEGFETNFANQLILEKVGFKPVPVIHDCYSDEIQTYIDRGYKLVAIGSGELKHAGQDELYRIVNDLYQKGVKVHFLGCTEYKKLAFIPVYSADSTTWNRIGCSGRIFYWNPRRYGYDKKDEIALDGKVPKQNIDYHIEDYPFIRQLEEYLYSELGLCIEDLLGENRFFNRALVNIHYFVLLEELINREHIEQGFSFE